MVHPLSTSSLTTPHCVAPERVPAWLHTDDSAVPMLPALAQRVIELASDPDVGIHVLSNVVSKDQVLAARVLSLANSAYFGAGRSIDNLTQAIVRLGTGSVRNVVITVGFASRMQDPAVYGPHGLALVDHALGTAYLARIIADQAGISVDEAFLGGLLHDVGKLVILRQAHEYTRRTGRQLPPEEVATAVAEHHPWAGATIMRRWNLPDPLDVLVRHHHDYTAAPEAQQQVAVVYLANRLSHRYGFGCGRDEVDLLGDPVCTLLDLDDTWLSTTDEHAPGLFAVARQILT